MTKQLNDAQIKTKLLPVLIIEKLKFRLNRMIHSKSDSLHRIYLRLILQTTA